MTHASRCVSINSQLEHEFTSNLVYPQAILIEDINEDNKNEIIVGNSNGEIFVYKGSQFSPWLKFSNSKIGCIVCLAYDVVTNSKKKYLIVHDSIGYVYLLYINPVHASRKRYCSDIPSKMDQKDWKVELRLMSQFKLIINPKNMIVDDFNNSGSSGGKQMIIGYSDRSVRIYCWVTNNSMSSSMTSSTQASSSSYPIQENGRFIIINSWELPNQIDQMFLVKDYLNFKDLIVTQPGNQILTRSGIAILCKTTAITDTKLESNSSSSSSLADLACNPSLSVSFKSSSFLNSYDEIVNFSSEINDPNRSAIPTLLVANVNFNKSNSYAYIVTMNGDVFFFKLTLTNSIIKVPLWHRSINNIIVMKCCKLDINNDNNDELMIATPDGQIFAINCSGDIICFDLGEPIKAFHLGLYQSELFTSTISLIDPVSSDNDLYQPNQGAFESVLDGSFQNDETSNPLNNTSCAVFISAITNKICLLQTDCILPYSKYKPSQNQFRYKCENIFSKRYLNPKLLQALDSVKSNPKLQNDLIYEILYQ